MPRAVFIVRRPQSEREASGIGCRKRRTSALRPFSLATTALLLALALGSLGCEQREAPPSFVARVGDQYLTHDEVDGLLATVPAGQDSAAVQEQFVQQWITQALLYWEAERRGLGDSPDVRRRLRENERSVLVSALLDTLYREASEPAEPAAMQSYFEQHQEQLRLREPFVRVRYLAAASADAADEARQQIQQATAATADSLWQALVRRFATDVEAALALSGTHYPEQRLFATQPTLRQALSDLAPGEAAPVLTQGDSLFYVLQLVDRVPAGTVPELAWVEAELRQHLAIETRKQMLERQVQRLRNEALAREELEIR